MLSIVTALLSAPAAGDMAHPNVQGSAHPQTLSLVGLGAMAGLHAKTNPTHYGDPSGGCMADELMVDNIQGYTGDTCAPKCTSSSCPTDKPTGVSAIAYCGLTSGTDKYCILECTSDSDCDTAGGAACSGAGAGKMGLCLYASSPAPPTQTHYGDPFKGCRTDEISITITGFAGEVCSPACDPSTSACPKDMPPGVSALPYCGLSDPTGKKYCVLECQVDENDACGPNASCKKNPSSPSVGLCTYDS